MKQTKEQIIEKAKKVLIDIEFNWYFEDTIKVFNSEETKYFYTQFWNGEKWVFYANIPSEQFANRNDATIGIVFSDELEPIVFLDGTGGRIPNLKISQKNGKYFIDGIWEGE
ncbi:MAG TPA: hypothetical protein PKX92_05830 [Edaphocola sp.]|nr:hypothetical protein [Edaphocola sp.]